MNTLKNRECATIAIPSKGRLKERVLQFLEKKGYPVLPPKGRELWTTIVGKEHLKVIFLHAKDIAVLIDEEVIDIGFTGLDCIFETKASIRPVVRLGECKVKICILVSEESPSNHPFHLLNKVVATPFPNIAKAYFEKLKVKTNIRPIVGSSEGIPALKICDAIVDIVETGESAKDNGLKIIAEDLFESECVCAVKKPELQPNYRVVHQFLRDIYE